MKSHQRPLGESSPDAGCIGGALATVTVTYNPCLEELEDQLRALPASAIKVVVDNASRPQSLAGIESLIQRFANTKLIRNDANIGLGAAVNRGVQWVATLERAPELVLLLDQDSKPTPGSIEALVRNLKRLDAAGHKVGCVGPLLLDPTTGLTHGFHQCSRWRWKRINPSIGSPRPIPCASLNGSGTLVPVELFQRLGGLAEELFIDHVDTEWSFRILANGYGLWGIPKAVFEHAMGQSSVRIWCFGWRVWPVRPPNRHYYLFRNAMVLMGRAYVPRVWKVWALAKMLLTAGVVSITGPSRGLQIKNMWQGVRNGLDRRGG